VEPPPLQRVGACVLAFAAVLFATAPAGAATRDVHGKPRAGGAYVFRLAGVRSAKVTRAQLSSEGKTDGVAARRIQRAARRSGRLRLRPHGALSHCARERCKLTLRLWLRYDSHATVSRDARACIFGQFDAGAWPGPCWRPYSETSPFNRPLPADPRLASDSDEIVAKVAGWGEPENKYLTPGSARQADYGHPYYFSRAGDPKFTVHCVASWGRCPIEGKDVHIPDAAEPANGPDAHMGVIDQAHNWEYNFFQVRDKPRGGGRLTVTYGGRNRIGTNDSTGLHGSGTAADFGLSAGVIRAPEIASLDIPHALFMVVKCTSGKSVFPSGDGAGSVCSESGASNDGAPPMGTRFQLDMSDAEIDALGAPPLQTAILRAMAHYGMYVGDTGGDRWHVLFESDATYTSFGRPAQVRQAFKQLGAHHDEDSANDYWVLDTIPIDWQHHLRVVDPCVTRGRC
jgi:hypothetical protein